MNDPFKDKDLPNIWRDVSDEEFKIICETGCLTPRLKMKLCRMMDIQNVPEGDMKIMINKDDLDRIIWEEWKAHPEHFKKKPPKPRRQR